jgi:hypothetical protein
MKYLKELLAQLFTLLGFFIAWVVLEGTARTIAGWMILGAVTIWLVSLPFRDKE